MLKAETVNDLLRKSSRPNQIELTMTVRKRVPDPLQVSRFRRTPELGPSILFFSGGTALNGLSRSLVEYTHNSVHLVTPFDSGGSSRVLRDAFGMLSVGDLRSRLMALADTSVKGNREIYNLFAFRMRSDASDVELRSELRSMVEGHHGLVSAIHDPMRKIIRNHLRIIYQAMPESLDLRGASIGNLILVGGYLNNESHIDPVVYMFGKLVESRGVVRTITNANYHLVADLEDGTQVVGQRELTGKEVPPIQSPVKKLSLSPVEPQDAVNGLGIREKTRALIRDANLIVFPIGSFYSSVVANLLPHGVVEEIASNPCPKVYIPNMGHDPEQLGMSVADCVDTLLQYLRRGAEPGIKDEQLLNFVVVDSSRGNYASPINVEAISKLGVQTLDLPLVTERSQPLIDDQSLIAILLSLA